MIDFEEELKKFHVMPEVDEVQEAIYRNNPADVMDLVQDLARELKVQEMTTID